MTAFGNYSHANMDMEIFTARNSVCDLIGEITRVRNSKPDQNAFIYLSNDKFHAIQRVFQDANDNGKTIKDSTIGAKKLFLDAAVKEFASRLSDNNEINTQIKQNHKKFFNADDYKSPDAHEELNKDIDELHAAIEAYRQAVVLDLAKRQAEILGNNVAKEFNDTNDVDSETMTQNHANAIAENMDKLWGEDRQLQEKINEAFLVGFKNVNQKELPDYVENIQNKQELNNYKIDKTHLAELAKAAYTLHAASLKKTKEDTEKSAANTIAAFARRNAVLKEKAVLLNDKLKKFINNAETTIDAKQLDDERKSLNVLLKDLPEFALKIIRTALEADSTCSNKLQLLQFALPSEQEFIKSARAVATPADIQKCCEARLDAARNKHKLFSGEFILLSQEYQAAIANPSKIDSTIINSVNDFPHAIAHIFGDLRKSTTGSSRFF